MNKKIAAALIAVIGVEISAAEMSEAFSAFKNDYVNDNKKIMEE